MFKRILSSTLIIIIIFTTMSVFTFAEDLRVNPTREEVEEIIERVALKRGIPSVILKSLARVESVFQQFKSDGSVYTGPMGSIGLMQINNRSAGFDSHKLKYDIEYNIEAGATMLLRKWDETVRSYSKIPSVGNMDPNILENWYFALWAYNGWHKSNNPNMVPYRFPTYIKTYAYQDLIYMVAEKEYDQPISSISSALLPNDSTPSKYTNFETPTPMHYGDIVTYEEEDIVRVDVENTLRYRKEPNGETLGKFVTGDELEILDGPVLKHGYYWYEVINNETGETGWVAKNWIYKIGEKHVKDGNDSWAKEYINDLKNRNIIDEDVNEFYPNKLITREELFYYIAKGFGFEVADIELSFDDKDEINEDYVEYIKTIIKAGYIKGNSDNLLNPRDYLSRQELAVVLSRITGIKESAEITEYNDLENISSWALDSVMNTYRLGLMQGKQNNMFGPKDNLTRAEAAKVISELLKMYNY